VLDAQPQPLGGGGDRGMGALLAGAIWIARHARFIEPIASQLLEQCRGQLPLFRHSRNDIHVRIPPLPRSGGG
jgi:hypothetical protein